MNFGNKDETFEFKKSTNELNEAMNSICAMLNKHGKKLFLEFYLIDKLKI